MREDSEQRRRWQFNFASSDFTAVYHLQYENQFRTVAIRFFRLASLASDLWSNHSRVRSANCWVHKHKFLFLSVSSEKDCCVCLCFVEEKEQKLVSKQQRLQPSHDKQQKPRKTQSFLKNAFALRRHRRLFVFPLPQSCFLKICAWNFVVSMW